MNTDSIVNNYNNLIITGFYADPSKGIKGNNGLMDQVLAMKWVNRNIKYFNGDPSKVTIHGHSAGAIDAALHLLSDLTKGIIKKYNDFVYKIELYCNQF